MRPGTRPFWAFVLRTSVFFTTPEEIARIGFWEESPLQEVKGPRPKEAVRTYTPRGENLGFLSSGLKVNRQGAKAPKRQMDLPIRNRTILRACGAAKARPAISAAMDLHKALGPGHLDSAYEGVLAVEFSRRARPNDRITISCSVGRGFHSGKIPWRFGALAVDQKPSFRPRVV